MYWLTPYLANKLIDSRIKKVLSEVDVAEKLNVDINLYRLYESGQINFINMHQSDRLALKMLLS